MQGAEIFAAPHMGYAQAGKHPQPGGRNEAGSRQAARRRLAIRVFGGVSFRWGVAKW